ncbi:MAG: PHP domain-containing protein [Butyricicoccus sp.]|nr:PHP domain-containing protein [Butyricicoccus sp.]
MLDLHTHSTASDGQYTPTELVHLAAQKGVTVLSLTDHDTTAGLAEAAQAAAGCGIHFIPGIELDTKYPGIRGNFHMLGYGIDPEHPALAAQCADFAEQRLQRANRIFSYLESYGIHLDRDKVFAYAGPGVIARPHFARVMLESGYVSSIQEAFDRYLDTPEFQTIDRPKPHPKEAIQMIRQAGGIPVLAHPYQMKLGEHSLPALLEELKNDGLGGLECYYSTHTAQQTEELLALAGRYGLYITGGSDFHGEKIKPQIALATGIDHTLQVRTTLPLCPTI